MACPYKMTSVKDAMARLNTDTDDFEETNNGEGTKQGEDYDYNSYLRLDRLLSCQDVPAGKFHDEWLFVITHQAYELWFKQILLEVDSVRGIFSKIPLEESNMLVIINRLNRVNLILKLLVEQFQILETMTPQDFLEFRVKLGTASGFQSFQFRLIENKLGLKESNRIQYNKQNYGDAFDAESPMMKNIEKSVEEKSLHDLVMNWLERTPGLESFNFWRRYSLAANMWIQQEFYSAAEQETDPDLKKVKTEEYKKQKDAFDALFDEKRYDEDKARGNHRFTYKAFQGAMMISCYRDEPRFHQPYHMLKLLLDVDSNLTKWRYNHVMMVQRMLGSKIGTGGSSGYQYLRSTISDRYKIFLDLFHLSTYLIPRRYIPVLNNEMKRRLSIMEFYQCASPVPDPTTLD
ncbi:tryptophan 2,3-dioxygenase-like [Tubulanus polymorphus]|uniref:tryptophan 2,3-dioxygenase-like n=1 Tax=Tubulanus polymorphus TaxID=672921 RepID=UPI003DA39C68